MPLTQEQLQALQAVLAESQAAPPQQQAQQQAPQQREPEPLSFNWGGQTYQARDTDELQRQLDELQRQQDALRNADAVRAQAAAAQAEEQRRHPQEGPRFDKDEYAGLFLKDPVAAQEYLLQHTPTFQRAIGVLATRQYELDLFQQGERFLRENPDYNGSDDNFRRLEGIRQQYQLPSNAAGWGMAWLHGKNSGVFKVEQAQQEPEVDSQGRIRDANGRFVSSQPEAEELSEEQQDIRALGGVPYGRPAPPQLPRRRPSVANATSAVLDNFENLSADKMREALLRMEQAGITQ